MESYFELDVLLPQMKIKLMSGTRDTQMWVTEQILRNLKKIESKRDHFVEKLVKCDIISIICDAMQATSDEHFVKVIIEFLDIVSVYKEFYENHTAMSAIKSMISISYCVYTPLKDTVMFEQIIQCVCNILVRSMKLAIAFDNVCIPQQVIFFIKDLDIQDLRNDKIKFMTITILNMILRQVTIDESIDVEIIIDVSCDALKVMREIVKYNDDNMISQATVILCGICAGSSRFCFKQNSQTEKPEISQKKNNLLICTYNIIQDIIIPYVKDADLSHVDLNEFRENFIYCLNNLYRLENCSHDKLSNHLVVNGYLKYFLLLAPELPEKLRRNICTLLSQILSVLSKKTFLVRDKDKFAYSLRKDFLDLISKNSTKELWNNVIASYPGNTGTALLILLYYHFQGTGENDIISLESLIARILLFSISKPNSVLIFKPLWFLFAVTSMSHQYPNLICNYKNAVIALMNTLQELEISKFYTHHIDLLRYCLNCSNLSHNLLSQILNLWLIESDGDIEPLLSINCDKVVRHLLIVIQNGYPLHIIDAAVKGFSHLIQINKTNNTIVEQIAETVWHMLPNILSTYYSDQPVTHIKAVLELANIIQPHVMSIEVIIRSAYNIVYIILKKDTDSKFMTLVITQAHILLVSAVSYKSFKVLQIYVQQSNLLKELLAYGFSKERSELSTISIKLLTFIIHCQEKSSIKCKVPIKIHIKSLLDLLVNVHDSSNCISEMQFICDLLKQNVDGSAVVLQKISNPSDVNTIIYLYEVFHRIHAMTYQSQWDMIYQSLMTLLYFCNTEVTTKVSYICDMMNNYNLITNVVKTRYISHHFVKFVIMWLYYRKTTCDVLWNPRSLGKLPFDKALNDLKKYSVMLNDKGLKDDYENLQNALSQFQ